MRLLIVGTLKGQLTLATKYAMDKGAQVTHAENADQALAVLRSGRGADLLMVDVALDIASLVTRLTAEHIHAPIVACGIDTDAKAAVAAIHAGAKEYIPLPPDPEMIAAVLAAVADDDREMVWRDESMGHVVKLAQQIAGSDASVLITGESGTGKEVLARFVHARSKRAKKHFISVNCAAIPEALLESELFGHEKGAFTGAGERRIGRFELADGGTLFLDEVGEIPLDMQVKLLRVLQEREFERAGGSQTIRVDVRVVAATNRDLLQAVGEGKFRQDLYYRLHVFPVTLPPLRERAGDLPLLIHHFVQRHAARIGRRIERVSDATLARLAGYAWPGNVRELENVIERAVILARGPELEVDAAFLDPRAAAATPAAIEAPVAAPVRTLEERERQH
ncbi:MAG: sigma-54-dependent Fis family transcriptional regulator, partial [Parvularculaceae bacterium]|nr:sigma-54-dependent Fis family transcriptional regulator [Parvularculaceae bacterium]